MIERTTHLESIEGLIGRHPVVAVIGARQVGKTTLACQIGERWKGERRRFDLEDPQDLSRFEDPILALENLKGLVILDEIQRIPDVFPILRVLAGRPGCPARFLILGSASPGLLKQSSESLAGRIAYYHLSGFTLDEIGAGSLSRLWLRGGFPRSYCAESDSASAEWLRFFRKSFAERDLPAFGVLVPSVTMTRFWIMLAHYHGQIWNASEFSRSFGVADTTVRRYLDTLTDTFVVRQQQPWFENIGKRQVKSPKVFLADSGLLHSLLGLETLEDLEGHPKVGASWEGFAMDVVCSHLGVREEERFFWETHGGADLDLLVVRGNRRLGFEMKRTSTPGVRRSMRTAMSDLGLESLTVIHAGRESYDLAPKMRAVALREALQEPAPL